MRTAPRSALPALLLAGVTLLAMAALAFGLLDPRGWRMGVTTVAGLSLASTLLAMIGRLMRREWLDLIEDELLPAGALLPLCLLLTAPLLLFPGDALGALPTGLGDTARRELWFSGWFVTVRLVAGVLVATGFTLALARRGKRARTATIGLPVIATIFMALLIDWDLAWDGRWWTPAIPLVAMVDHLAAAMALTFVYHLTQREAGESEEFASLAAALLSLALLAIWSNVVQYLIAWFGNLPGGSGWYLSRFAALPWALPASGLLATGAVLLLLWSRGRKVMLAAAMLMLAAYALHSAWWFMAASLATLAPFALVVALWAGWLALLARAHDRWLGR